MGKLSGTTWASIKKYPAIAPLYFFMACGVALSSFYLARIAIKSPEVSWNRRGNPEPWNAYDGKQYKFLSSGRDYSEPSTRPKY